MERFAASYSMLFLGNWNINERMEHTLMHFPCPGVHPLSEFSITIPQNHVVLDVGVITAMLLIMENFGGFRLPKVSIP